MQKETVMKFKRCQKDQAYGIGYVSTDNKWAIYPEGTATYWVAAELNENTYPIEETKQYFRSYQEGKDYVNRSIAQQAGRFQKTDQAFSAILKGIAS